MMGFPLPARWKRPPVGLDIGASGVRVARLARVTRGRSDVVRAASTGAVRYTVVGFASSEWAQPGADDASGDPARTAGQDVLARHVQSCLRKANVQGGRVGAALNPPDIEFHPMELPQAVLKDQEPSGKPESADVTQVVRWEVARLRSEPVDAGNAVLLGSEIRHWRLPATPVPAPNVIAVAAMREAVARTLTTCTGAGLQCAYVDAGAAAAARLGALLNNWSAEQVWGVLDVGYGEARLVLCVDDVPVLVRRAGSGGEAWTQRIAKCLQVSVKAAEVHKREHGIALIGRGVRRGSQQAPGSEVAAILHGALRGELKELASEVKRSYEYVLSCYPRRRAADLVLIGGGAVMPNLPEFLSGALGITVRRASDYLGAPSCRVSYAAADQDRLELIAQAVGIAVGH